MSTPPTALEFAHLARLLGGAARQRGLIAPSFRSPPRIVGVTRSLRRFRRDDGETATVAVVLRDRAQAAVLADMIEGVVAANRLSPPQSDRVRSELWEVVAKHTSIAA